MTTEQQKTELTERLRALNPTAGQIGQLYWVFLQNLLLSAVAGFVTWMFMDTFGHEGQTVQDLLAQVVIVVPLAVGAGFTLQRRYLRQITALLDKWEGK